MRRNFLFILLGLFPTIARAFNGEVEINGLWYNIVTKGQTAEVIKYKSLPYSGDIVIPSTITYEGVECTVSSIGQEAFRGCSGVSSITIPSSIKKIGKWAFFNCNLDSVDITDLSAWCKIEFEYSDTFIPSEIYSNPLSRAGHLFIKGKEVTNIVLPNDVVEISNGAFFNCQGLSSITLSNNTKKIGKAVFCHCENLETIIIPDSLSTIGEQAFYGCSKLNDINIPHSLKTIEQYLFYQCASLQSITIPDSVSKIGNYAFYLCSNLKTIKLGRGITGIGYRSFSYCSEITDVYCLPEKVPTTGLEAFSESDVEYATLHIPYSAINEYSSKSQWKDFKEFVKLPRLIYMIDDQIYQSVNYIEGDSIFSIIEPKKEGYTFNGWDDIPKYMPDDDLIINSLFTINKYALKYYVDGQLFHEDSIEYSANLQPITSPFMEGYTFSGWSEIPATMPAKDVEITGTFSINSYILTYKVNEEVYKKDTLNYATVITPLAEPTKEGYTFSGWSEIPETMPANDVEITGTFTINKYLLIVMIDDEVVYSDSIAFGSKLADYADTIKQQGIDISQWEWYDQIEIITMPAHDVTIIAVRDAIRPITIDVDDTEMFDLTGKKIYTDDITNLPAGIYILNGRKFIIQ